MPLSEWLSGRLLSVGFPSVAFSFYAFMHRDSDTAFSALFRIRPKVLDKEEKIG